MIVGIMVEVLSILAIATRVVCQDRAGKPITCVDHLG